MSHKNNLKMKNQSRTFRIYL